MDEILNLIESVSEDFPSYSCRFEATQSDLLCDVPLMYMLFSCLMRLSKPYAVQL